MFVNTQDLNLNDFLEFMEFIPPSGKSVEYFITPEKIKKPTPGYIEENSFKGDSIIYTRQDPATKISQQSTPLDYGNSNPPKIENSGPKDSIVPKSTKLDSLKCPFIGVLSNDALGTDLLLKESIGPFYKNTIFHCV